jgi:hypothetical protein
VDLQTVSAALDRLYTKAPHLPRLDDMATTILDAYRRRSAATDGPHPMGRVLYALWPIGAEAGARRGHAITVGAIQAEVAQAIADRNPDPRSRWLILGMAMAADALPSRPKPRRYGLADKGRMVAYPATLDQALAVGLFSAWRAGHADGAERAFSLFLDAVVDLIGHERLSTTFLAADLPALALLDEIGYGSYRAAELDREHPTKRQPRADQPTPAPGRPAGSSSFRRLRGLDPDRRLPMHQPRRPGTGPGRHGPGR